MSTTAGERSDRRAGSAPLVGVVLAGGSSRRMGVDKALLDLDGERLVDRVVRRIADVCAAVVVASGRRFLPRLAVPQVSDRRPDAGPLAGILAGMEALAATHPDAALCAVVAVDLPDASGDVLDLLARTWDGRAAAVVPVVSGQQQPLHAVYATQARPRLAALSAAGEASPRTACDRLGSQIVGPTVWGSVDVSGAFARNLNRPDDVARWQEASR